MQDISNLIYKYANSFDKKDWDELKTILAEEITCDYQDLRGTQEIVTAKDFIDKRIKALHHLKTQHIFANLEIYQDGNEANCVCTALILRSDNEDFFNTHAIYEFGLSKINSAWRIIKIKQTVLWNEGNPHIHAGAANKKLTL
jgi:3-phenylpropionate/cinnamic acid dioxygenase small subunit